MKATKHTDHTYVISKSAEKSINKILEQPKPHIETFERHINPNSEQEPLFDIQVKKGISTSNSLISGGEEIIATNYLNVFYDSNDIISIIYKMNPGEKNVPFEFSFWSNSSKLEILKSSTKIENRIYLNRFASADNKVQFFLDNAHKINNMPLFEDFYTIVFAILKEKEFTGQNIAELMKKVDELYANLKTVKAKGE